MHPKQSAWIIMASGAAAGDVMEAPPTGATTAKNGCVPRGDTPGRPYRLIGPGPPIDRLIDSYTTVSAITSIETGPVRPASGASCCGWARRPPSPQS